MKKYRKILLSNKYTGRGVGRLGKPKPRKMVGLTAFSYSVAPQKLNQLIGIEHLTSCFLENLGA